MYIQINFYATDDEGVETVLAEVYEDFDLCSINATDPDEVFGVDELLRGLDDVFDSISDELIQYDGAGIDIEIDFDDIDTKNIDDLLGINEAVDKYSETISNWFEERILELLGDSKANREAWHEKILGDIIDDINLDEVLEKLLEVVEAVIDRYFEQLDRILEKYDE